MQDPSTYPQAGKWLLAMAMIWGGILMAAGGIALWWSVAEPTQKPHLSIYLMGLGTTIFVIGMYARWESRQGSPDEEGKGTPIRAEGRKKTHDALPASGRAATLAACDSSRP